MGYLYTTTWLTKESLQWEHFCGLTSSKNRSLLLDLALCASLLAREKRTPVAAFRCHSTTQNTPRRIMKTCLNRRLTFSWLPMAYLLMVTWTTRESL
ncbi:hypothetical protein NC652_003244 [Populus alba x Populus x berolinensis]|nr:hypothetical protein NC652_003244 [Populus alba x Populus x berolinensis]